MREVGFEFYLCPLLTMCPGLSMLLYEMGGVPMLASSVWSIVSAYKLHNAQASTTEALVQPSCSMNLRRVSSLNQNLHMIAII